MLQPTSRMENYITFSIVFFILNCATKSASTYIVSLSEIFNFDGYSSNWQLFFDIFIETLFTFLFATWLMIVSNELTEQAAGKQIPSITPGLLPNLNRSKFANKCRNISIHLNWLRKKKFIRKKSYIYSGCAVLITLGTFKWLRRYSKVIGAKIRLSKSKTTCAIQYCVW